MLNEHKIAHTYREYTREPLTQEELVELLKKLGVGPRDMLRSREASRVGLADDLSDEAVIAAIVDNPRLLQRPIGVVGDRAILGRPAEQLLTIV